MTNGKVHFPSPGCVVEFLHGNAPVQALVLDEQSGRLRLYSVGKRELNLPPGRILPWSGPGLGLNLSRQGMDESLEECRALRASTAAGISALELWELAQGEVRQASAEWLAGLLWDKPDIHQEAALGHALLAAKTHFRFSPPDFEIFPRETVQKRMAEAENARCREAFASAGAQFFHKLWDIHLKKRPPLDKDASMPNRLHPEADPVRRTGSGGLPLRVGDERRNEMPGKAWGRAEISLLRDVSDHKEISDEMTVPPPGGDEELFPRLRRILLDHMANPDRVDDSGVWKLLSKGLPDIPHLAPALAEAWGIVPLHHNFLLDRIDYERGEAWARSFAGECAALAAENARLLDELEQDATPYVSVDDAHTLDRDDALHLERDKDAFTLRVALACPALAWPFRGDLDRVVQKRATSLYLPEGNEHMLPAGIGRELFSLDQGRLRPALVFTLRLSAEGALLEASPCLRAVRTAENLDLERCERLLGSASDMPLAGMLQDALHLAGILQKRRLASGAVIIERPDPEITLREEEGEVKAFIGPGPQTPLTHMLVEEIMVLCNSAAAAWGGAQDLALLHRTQNVALPREFSGIWREAQDIARVVRSLPPAVLECRPRRHAGLGLDAYATVTSPIRRYVDLLNQGQIAEQIRTGAGVFSRQELEALLPSLAAAGEAAGQVQRLRPRYWKYLFFKQQGDRRWWDAVVIEENEHYVNIALPWAQITARGKRRSFDEKIYPGMRVKARLGKVDPLIGDMQVLELAESQ
ncbi:MAG: RNB domain-containing ribonuclease [Desulfovibrio sp.]|jgi:exoribonuclease-2|nr:RNB domain-containing ribonuclease [Desulfovibrio sp.]